MSYTTHPDTRLSPEEIFSLFCLHGGDLNAHGVTGLSVILAATHRDGTSPNFPVLHYLLERERIPRTDQIDALEMAGAVLLGRNENHERFHLAFQYWRRALALRLMDTEDCRPIYKEPTNSKSGQLSEWSTLADLERIEQDPAQRLIQSLLVRLRISARLCWAAVREWFHPSFSNFFSPVHRIPHGCSMSQILDRSWTTLDTILRSKRPHEDDLLDSVYYLELLLIDIFQHLPKGNVNLNSINLEKLLELLLMKDLPYLTSNPNLKLGNLIALYLMVEILSKHPELITEAIQCSLLRLVHRFGRNNGLNLLHEACIWLESSLSSIRFLVKLGADPNARVVTNRGYGVLHILSDKPESETRDAAARLLLENGAHLDMADNFGRTAADHWVEKKRFVFKFPNLFDGPYILEM